MPDPQTDDVINYLLQKADQSLESAQSEFQAKRFDFAVNWAYYACFYSASAIMLQRGKQFVKHTGLRSAIHKDLVKPGYLAPHWGKVFDRAFETRQEADYLILFSFPPEQVERIIQDSVGFVQAMRELLESPPKTD
ncbi:MAG: HEPN domain-containing protein [Tildeniella torsiva UHER 1998/13D]|nr:HEPN domain-containing protein [Tildeniella torsiva UHER 1998/13D]